MAFLLGSGNKGLPRCLKIKWEAPQRSNKALQGALTCLDMSKLSLDKKWTFVLIVGNVLKNVIFFKKSLTTADLLMWAMGSSVPEHNVRNICNRARLHSGLIWVVCDSAFVRYHLKYPSMKGYAERVPVLQLLDLKLRLSYQTVRLLSGWLGYVRLLE